MNIAIFKPILERINLKALVSFFNNIDSIYSEGCISMY